MGDDCGGAHGGDDVLRNGSGGAPAKSRTGVSFELLVLSFQIFKTYYILSIFFFYFLLLLFYFTSCNLFRGTSCKICRCKFCLKYVTF